MTIPKGNDASSQDEQLGKETRSLRALGAGIQGCVYPVTEIISGKTPQCTQVIVARNMQFGGTVRQG